VKRLVAGKLRTVGPEPIAEDDSEKDKLGLVTVTHDANDERVALTLKLECH